MPRRREEKCASREQSDACSSSSGWHGTKSPQKTKATRTTWQKTRRDARRSYYVASRNVFAVLNPPPFQSHLLLLSTIDSEVGRVTRIWRKPIKPQTGDENDYSTIQEPTRTLTGGHSEFGTNWNSNCSCCGATSINCGPCASRNSNSAYWFVRFIVGTFCIPIQR